MKPTSALFITDYSFTIRLTDGEAPYSSLSHMSNMFNMAHEAARMGWDTYIKAIDTDQCYKILQMFPVLQLDRSQSFEDPEFQPDIMVALYPEFMLHHAYAKPDAIKILNVFAHTWLENTRILHFDFIDNLRVVLAHHIDFVIAQNPRMKDIFLVLAGVAAKWDHPERIACAPLGYVPEELAAAAHFDRATARRNMGLTDDDICIINSGGPWDWTDIEAFLEGFVKAVRGGATRIKFYQMGLRQKTNTDHEYAMTVFRRIMRDNYDLVGRQLIVIEEWERASSCLPEYNYGADIGINISKDSTENFQAHRVRFLEYIKAGLPVLNTLGDYLSTYDARDACLLVTPGDVDGYASMLRRINDREFDLHQMHKAAAVFRDNLSSDKNYPPAFEAALAAGRLPKENRQWMIQNLAAIYKNYDFTTGRLNRSIIHKD